MEKKELKLKKETLSNLTNLNIREMEELKGGGVATAQQALAAQKDEASLTITVTGSASWSITVSWSW